MTALASILFAALPGGLVPTVKAGVAAAPGVARAFEGLLAGLTAGQADGRGEQRGQMPIAAVETDAAEGDETNLDLGLTSCLVAPGLAPLFQASPPPKAVNDAAPDAPADAAETIADSDPPSLPTRLAANLWTSTSPATATPAGVARTEGASGPRPRDIAGVPQTPLTFPEATKVAATTAARLARAVTAAVAPVVAAPAGVAATVAPASPVSVPAAPVVAPAPAPVDGVSNAPPALATTLPASNAVIAEAVAPAVMMRTAETDNRRPAAPTVARVDRREAVGRAAPAAATPSAPRPSPVAVERAAAASGLASPGEADPEILALIDAAEAPETRQPALPAEARAAPAQTIAGAPVQAEVRGSPETVAKLAADIVRKLDGQRTRFDLQLDPMGLGKVDVAIEIDRNGRLTAAMTFDSPQSAADLRGRAGELRLALESAGFDVSEGGLTFDMSGHGAGFGGRETGEERAWNGRAFQRAQTGAEEADAALAAATSTPARRTRSGVDIRI